jgi:ribonuclease HI
MKKIQFDGAAIPNPGKMGIGVVLTLTPHGWGIAHDKKQKFGVNSSFKSVTIGFLWY